MKRKWTKRNMFKPFIGKHVFITTVYRSGRVEVEQGTLEKVDSYGSGLYACIRELGVYTDMEYDMMSKIQDNIIRVDFKPDMAGTVLFRLFSSLDLT